INSSLILLTTPPPAKLDFNNSLNTAQTYIVNTSAQLAALSNNILFSENVKIIPTENITATLVNFSMKNLRDFYVFGNFSYTINITIKDCNFTRAFIIYGNPAIKFDNCRFQVGGYFSINSGGPTISINNSVFLGTFSSGGTINTIDLTISKTVFNQTVQNYGFIEIKVNLAGATVRLIDSNISNAVQLINVENVYINNSTIGSTTVSTLISRQGIYLEGARSIDIQSTNILYDSGSVKPQGIYLVNCQDGIIKNSNVANIVNLTSCINITIDTVGSIGEVYIDPSSDITVKNLVGTISKVEIRNSNVNIENINTNNLEIYGSNEQVSLKSVNVLSSINIDCSSNVQIDFISGVAKDITADSTSSNVVLTINHSTLNDVSLQGFITSNFFNVTLHNLIVYSPSKTSLENITITGTLQDHVNPTIQVSQNSIQQDYDIVLDREKVITISFSGDDNIIGSNYAVSFRILIYEDNSLITNKTFQTTSYTFTASTGSYYRIEIVCIDAQGNSSNSAYITVSFTPQLGTFFLILIIVLVSVAGATAAIVIYLFHRAKTRWKKTPILTVSPEKK
ncbi:MAG: hypothetical protein ACTSRP_23660, partial [Candidatus Helarchaeota archaeon]